MSLSKLFHYLEHVIFIVSSIYAYTVNWCLPKIDFDNLIVLKKLFYFTLARYPLPVRSIPNQPNLNCEVFNCYPHA